MFIRGGTLLVTRSLIWGRFPELFEASFEVNCTMEELKPREDVPSGQLVCDMKDALNSLMSQLSAFGLKVHVLQNRAVITERSESGTFNVVDGEAALQFVNQPEHADKIICFLF